MRRAGGQKGDRRSRGPSAPAVVLAALLALAGGVAAAEAPRRVVSINLCTDQLAIRLAAPGQLLSVTWLAQDPDASVMAEAARAFPTNRGRAEEVFLLAPDLVLAGTFTDPATVAMLRRLGIPVVTFPPARSLADVRSGLAAMGRVLHREAAAAAAIAAFDADLARLGEVEGPRLRAATWGANGWTAGERSLAGAIMAAAGLRSIAGELGLDEGGVLPLELLILAAPDLIVSARRYPGASHAEAVLDHPALGRLAAGRSVMQDRDWVCGLPEVLRAAVRLAEARRALLRP